MTGAKNLASLAAVDCRTSEELRLPLLELQAGAIVSKADLERFKQRVAVLSPENRDRPLFALVLNAWQTHRPDLGVDVHKTFLELLEDIPESERGRLNELTAEPSNSTQAVAWKLASSDERWAMVQARLANAGTVDAKPAEAQKIMRATQVEVALSDPVRDRIRGGSAEQSLKKEFGLDQRMADFYLAQQLDDPMAERSEIKSGDYVAMPTRESLQSDARKMGSKREWDTFREGIAKLSPENREKPLFALLASDAWQRPWQAGFDVKAGFLKLLGDIPEAQRGRLSDVVRTESSGRQLVSWDVAWKLATPEERRSMWAATVAARESAG